jgi:hypothetical protein
MKTVIDWSKAPEGATHCSSEGCFYKIDNKGNNDSVYCVDERWNPCALTNQFVSGLESKPEAKLTYTQEMHDNSELPYIGMEYLCGDNQLNECVAVIPNVSSHMVIGLMIEHISTRDYLPISQTRLCDIKPLTPPIELIDGKAYSFESPSHGGGIGYYDSANMEFININLGISAEFCTNIKLLEVKS